jgi:YD repeat-containing protein
MASAGGIGYGYDGNGNPTSRGTDSFAWDHENRMTSATVGGTTTTYAYNGDGLRVSQTTGGVTTFYVWMSPRARRSSFRKPRVQR